MAHRQIVVACFAILSITACTAYNFTGPELSQRSQFSDDALQFNYPESSLYSDSAAGQTYSMDLKSNPILATLPSPGLSGKIDNFQPCSLKIPHVHPRASKFSYVVSGMLEVGIAEEDTGRILDFNVSMGSAIVVPQGLIHYMRNNDCTQPLKMLTVFNNVDSGELTLLDKVLGFPTATAAASTGLDVNTLTSLRNSLPEGPGDLRIDPACQQQCRSAGAPSISASTAGK